MAERPTLPQQGQVIAEKYRLDHELGTGGMGAVFQVTHCVTGKRFALKWLLPEVSARGDGAQRFIREAQVACRIEHPNVVEVYDVGAEGDSFYMVMELLEGESLAARVERAGPMSLADVCRLLVPCMYGVAEAHAAGIVHRDLKPANIFICRPTRSSPEYAKVLDFGISKMAGAPDLGMGMTKSGMLIGTPHYMPLEQMRGRAVDHTADIYSLGVVLYQVLSGKLPYPADTFSDLVLMLANATPKPLDELVPGLPRGLSKVIGRAMARDPEARYPHVEAMLGELERFAAPSDPRVSTGSAQAAVSLPPAASLSLQHTPLSTESQFRSRNPRSAVSSSSKPKPRSWIYGGVAALALALIAGGYYYYQRDGLIAGALQPKPAAAPAPLPAHATTPLPAHATTPLPAHATTPLPVPQAAAPPPVAASTAPDVPVELSTPGRRPVALAPVLAEVPQPRAPAPIVVQPAPKAAPRTPTAAARPPKLRPEPMPSVQPAPDDARDLAIPRPAPKRPTSRVPEISADDF